MKTLQCGLVQETLQHERYHESSSGLDSQLLDTGKTKQRTKYTTR